MNKIKRLLAAMILLVIPICVFAKQNIIGTDIVDVNVPENWKLFTRNNIEEMLNWLNIDKNQKSNYEYNWRTNYYYFDIENDSKDKKIILINKPSDFEIDDLSIYMDDDIINTFDELKKNYEGYDVKILLHTTLNGIKYYKVEYKKDADNLNIIEYITIIHGNTYKYEFQYSNEISKEVEKEVESIINSIEYENYLEFIENNTITAEPKKSNSSSIIIFIFLILIVGVGVYFFLMKKKKNNISNIKQQTFTPVNNINNLNPAVSDFLQINNESSNKIKNEKNNTDNKK